MPEKTELEDYDTGAIEEPQEAKGERKSDRDADEEDETD